MEGGDGDDAASSGVTTQAYATRRGRRAGRGHRRANAPPKPTQLATGSLDGQPVGAQRKPENVVVTCESASDEEVPSHLGGQSTGAQSLSDEITDGGECLLGGQPSGAQESTPGAGSPKSNHDDATVQSDVIVEVNGVGNLDGQPRGALAERSVCATMAKHATTATQTPPREYETTAAQTDLDEQLVWQIGGRQGAHSPA